MESVAEANYHPIALISILHRYSREDYGSIFLSLPLPKRGVDQEAWAWLQLMKSMGAARNQALATVGKTHQHLFELPPVCFEIYRLDQRSLNKIIAKL